MAIKYIFPESLYNKSGFNNLILEEDSGGINLIFDNQQGNSIFGNSVLVDLIGEAIVKIVAEQWVGSSLNIREIVEQWIGQKLDLEVFHDLYASNKYYVEVKSELYSGLQNVVEWYKEQYGYLNYLVEWIWNRYGQQKTYVEVYAGKYVKENLYVVDFDNKYVNCEVFVEPKIYIEPEFGEYENSIEVSITAELMPQSLKYGFGLNMGDYTDKFMVYRNRRLYVEADYGAYIVKKQGDYVITQLNGKKVYSDYTDVVWLIEELLWKKY